MIRNYFYNSASLLPATGLILLLALLPLNLTGQLTEESVSSFRQGRWLTSLSGKINSSSARVSGSQERAFTNDYGLDATMGKFIKERWLFGGVFSANRSNSVAAVTKSSETFFAGPQVSYYFAKAKEGSLFVSLALGYVRFLDATEFMQNMVDVTERTEGNGIGAAFELGYSYVIKDSVVFDFGISTNSFGIKTKRVSDMVSNPAKETLYIGNLSFFFGFNVLLDNFFF